MIQPTASQQAVLDACGPLLVTGGPGSGKTTVSILKAARTIESLIRPHQKVLFLSFARATVSRILRSIQETPGLSCATLDAIAVDTYHALFWRLLKCNGYLLGLPRRLEVLSPPAEAVALSSIRAKRSGSSLPADQSLLEEEIRAERLRLARAGQVSLNLFATYVAELLEGSQKLRALYGRRYPVLILDEFQDTNAEQWRAVKAMGRASVPVALADPEQRIYDFIGADPERLNQFRERFRPTEISLASENHRSRGTEIPSFADDMLRGTLRKRAYEGILIKRFPSNKNQAAAALLGTVLTARSRLVKSLGSDWTLAVLVPTKRMTRRVSGWLITPVGKFPPIAHSTVVDTDGVALAAEVLAVALEPASSERDASFIDCLCRFFRGKHGGTPTQGDLRTANSIERGYAKYAAQTEHGRKPSTTSIVARVLHELQESDATPRTGNPERDWLAIRRMFGREDADQRLRVVAEEVKYLHLLARGGELRHNLGETWRQFGNYCGALDAVRTALQQAHFASQARAECGVIVMNMHKSKGKEFDEVIIFEGWPNYVKGRLVANPDRIIRGNQIGEGTGQARQNLRVSITRAKTCTTILTPQRDPCVLLSGTV